MVIDEILNATGLPFKETRFIKPPKSTYCVWLGEFLNRGADNENLIQEASYSIELYSSKIDSVSEQKLEQLLNDRAIEFDKSDRYWIESEQLFQVVYSFEIILKRGL